MRRYLIFILLLLPLFPCTISHAQDIPHPVVNTGVYEFLDELAIIQAIDLNSVVKPYSRLFIARKLEEADSKREMLNKRQQSELDFYLTDFGKESGRIGEWRKGVKGEGGRKRWDLIYYSDSLFSVTINPIFGGEVFFNQSGRALYARNFVEARAYMKRWGFFASLRDNHEKPFLGLPEYLTKREGGHFKEGTDWSEMQGGITYSWKWGHAGFVKDRQQWGNNYNGANIFGGNNPTFVQVRLNLKPADWFEFNYFHGWLNSMEPDSSRSYWVNNSYGPDYRILYHRKYIAANMFTFTPFRNLNVSFGNSIVYSDKNFNPVYVMPLFFYKSVDHTYTSGTDNMNCQTFIDISSRNIKHLHLYATLFVDELSVARFIRNDRWNFLSWKTGFRLGNLPVQNLSFTTEFTYSYPLAFQHFVPTLTFETQRFNLGHYLRDNAREWYLALDYKPARTLNLGIYFTDAVRGEDHTELGTPRTTSRPLDVIKWRSTILGIRSSYQIINDLYVWLNFTAGKISGDTRWSPPYFYGNKNTLNAGMTYGF
jgi:hypothetical protein